MYFSMQSLRGLGAIPDLGRVAVIPGNFKTKTVAGHPVKFVGSTGWPIMPNVPFTLALPDLATAQLLVDTFGGAIASGYGYTDHATSDWEAQQLANEGVIITGLPPVPDVGQVYFWGPPAAAGKPQYQFTLDHGLLDPQQTDFLSKLSDGQFAMLVISLFVGGALAGGAMGTPATASTGTSAVVDSSGTVIGSVNGAGVVTDLSGTVVTTVVPENFELAALGGPAVGTGTELTASEFAAASLTPAVSNSVAANSLASEFLYPGVLANSVPGAGLLTPGGLTPGALAPLVPVATKLLTSATTPTPNGGPITPGGFPNLNLGPDWIPGISNTMVLAGAGLLLILTRNKTK